MKHCKLSYALILLVLAWSLSAASLLANGSPSQEGKSKQSVQPTNRTIPKSAETSKDSRSRGASKDANASHNEQPAENPVTVKILESDYLNKTSEQDEANKKENLEIQRKLTDYTFVLAIIAALQIAVLIAQVYYNRSLAVQQRIIERAYVKLSHVLPGMQFHEVHTVQWWVPLQVGNFGRTPARITHTVICFRYLPGSNDPAPVPPDYFHERQDRLEGAFLLPNDKAFLSLQGRFKDINEEGLIREGHGRFLIYGYVDYIDQFEQRHRAGYGREYNHALDDPDEYASPSDFEKRSNLPFIPETGYNYDRPRQKGEGNDWN